jgi:hypothetical protein
MHYELVSSNDTDKKKLMSKLEMEKGEKEKRIDKEEK